MQLYPGRLAAALDDFRQGIAEPTLERLEKAKISMDEVALLAYAEHAPERNAEIAKINDRFPNDGKAG